MDYGDDGLRNVRWALTTQYENGWFGDNCITDNTQPLTHTIGYAFRGVFGAHRLSGDTMALDASRRIADALLGVIRPDGQLAARLDAQWRPAADFVCLTGSAQIAHCLLMLYTTTGREAFLHKARALNAYVRRTINLSGAPHRLAAQSRDRSRST